jgi:uncharacterized protein (TIGR02646 family)
MRPVDRGNCPIAGDYSNYRDAFGALLDRFGPFCSYCERRIATGLAVEHIQPKANPTYRALEGRWENFLLACVNCNSTKGDKNVRLGRIFLPDRDNTFAAFEYLPSGAVAPHPRLNGTNAAQLAQDTLALTGLDRPVRWTFDNDELVAWDRMSQRSEVWHQAERARDRLARSGSSSLREQIEETATSTGFFSVWMTVFANDPDMLDRFVRAFPNTARNCWDASWAVVSPRPANGLCDCGKV